MHQPVVRQSSSIALAEQRAMFGAVTSFVSLAKNALVGFSIKAARENLTLSNAATQYFLTENKLPWERSVTTGDDGSQRILFLLKNYSELVFSNGNAPQNGYGTANFEDTLTVKAPVSIFNRGISHLVVYQPDLKVFLHTAKVTTAAGTNDTISIKVPSSWGGMHVHVWAYDQIPNEATMELEVGAALADGWVDMKDIANNYTFSKTMYIGTGEVN